MESGSWREGQATLLVGVLIVGSSYGARNVLSYARRMMQNFLAFRDYPMTSLRRSPTLSLGVHFEPDFIRVQVCRAEEEFGDEMRGWEGGAFQGRRKRAAFASNVNVMGSFIGKKNKPAVVVQLMSPCVSLWISCTITKKIAKLVLFSTAC